MKRVIVAFAVVLGALSVACAAEQSDSQQSDGVLTISRRVPASEVQKASDEVQAETATHTSVTCPYHPCDVSAPDSDGYVTVSLSLTTCVTIPYKNCECP